MAQNAPSACPSAVRRGMPTYAPTPSVRTALTAPNTGCARVSPITSGPSSATTSWQRLVSSSWRSVATGSPKPQWLL